MLYDFAAYAPDGRLSAVVEVKRQIGTDSRWAGQFRRNLVTDYRYPSSTLFAMVVPDRVYVWRPDTPAEATPDFEVDAGELLAPYFARVGAEPGKISPETFELLIGWWLGDVSMRLPRSVDRQIVASGLAEALAGGRVIHRDAA